MSDRPVLCTQEYHCATVKEFKQQYQAAQERRSGLWISIATVDNQARVVREQPILTPLRPRESQLAVGLRPSVLRSKVGIAGVRGRQSLVFSEVMGRHC